MFIRYHVFYMMLGMLCLVLGIYFHGIFFVGFLFYLIWLYNRLSIYHVLFCLMISLPMFFFSYEIQQPKETYIQGVVEKVSEKYCYVQTKYGMMKLYHEEQLQYKDEIECYIEYLDWNENTNDHAFNEKLYNYSQKVYLKAYLIQLKNIKHHSSFYHYIESCLSSYEDVAHYQRLLLLGQRDEGIQEDYQKLSQFSLVHLFALSGMHVHLLYGLLYGILGKICHKTTAKIIAYVMIGFYVFSIPMQISLYRAFFTMVLYELTKEYFNQLDIMSFLMIISLYYNPYIIFNISFVFSYFIYFIVLLVKEWKHSFFWIYLSTLPIVLNLNYQFPLFSFWIGSYLMPYIESFYILCLLSVVFPIVSELLLLYVHLFMKMMNFLDWIYLYIPFSKPTFSFIAMYYILYFMIIYKKSLRQQYKNIMLALVSLCISFHVYGQYKFYGEITMIDVGQGDCTLVRLPMNQGNILIDTGGNRDFDLATQTIIPYLKSIGIHQLDYVYISHDDFDHCGALESLQLHFPIQHVIKEFESHRQIGSLNIDMLEHSYSSDSNDQSLVMYLQFPSFQMLTLGDASVSVEKELYEMYHSLDVDILKVSHHGSHTSSGVDLFSLIHPQIAMIGVKKNNFYHHPSPQVIERLKRKNIMILRTDEDGMFHIRYIGNKYLVYR